MQISNNTPGTEEQLRELTCGIHLRNPAFSYMMLFSLGGFTTVGNSRIAHGANPLPPALYSSVPIFKKVLLPISGKSSLP
jgi:hypothetical protein